jgi:hypothetical protein
MQKTYLLLIISNIDLNFIMNQRDKHSHLVYQYILAGRKMLVAWKKYGQANTDENGNKPTTARTLLLIMLE